MTKKQSKSKKGYPVFFLLAAFVFSVVWIYFISYNLYCEAYPKKYQDFVERYSAEYQVDDVLVYSVIRSESRFNPDAVSDIGACGLMQITEETFDWAKSRMPEPDNATYADIFDPETNIKYGVYILHLLLDEFVDERTAVAAYHAGWGSVKEWLDDPEHSSNGQEIDTIPFQDTDAYVNQVLQTEKIYVRLYS